MTCEECKYHTYIGNTHFCESRNHKRRTVRISREDAERGVLMKFKKYTYMTDKNWVFIIPSVVLYFNDPIYREKNIAIQLHILIWHFKWFWIEKSAY